MLPGKKVCESVENRLAERTANEVSPGRFDLGLLLCTYNADSPNPARTRPVAVARVWSGKLWMKNRWASVSVVSVARGVGLRCLTFAAVLTAEASPALLPAPVANVHRHRATTDPIPV